MEKQRVVPLVLEPFLVEKVEAFRRERMEQTGYLSRSGAVRILVVRGLMAFSQDVAARKEDNA